MSNSDSTQTIWRSAARFFSGTMLSRITGMLRDMAMAYAFGTTSAVAALLVAFRFAHLLRRLLGEGAMQTALIPHFEELRSQDPQRAGRFFCDLAYSLSCLLIVLILFIMGGIGGLLASNVFNAGNAEIAWLTLLMMPSLLFICLFGINASLLQCEKSFFAPSAAPVIFNLFWILGVFFSATFAPEKAMTILSLFIIVACFAQWAITVPKVYRLLTGFKLDNMWKNTKGYSKDVLRLAKPLALGIIGVAAAQVNNALDAVFARWADDEGPALLWYAIRLQQLPLALFGIAIAGAILPPLARAIKANDRPQFRTFLEFGMRRSLALMIPMTGALFILGDGCVALIYGHGSFSNASVAGTTLCLWGYTAGLIPMALVLILAPSFYAKSDYYTPSMAATASMGINIALNTLLVAVFSLGAPSIALATSVSAWFNWYWLNLKLRKDGYTLSLVSSTAKITLATAIAMGAIIIADNILWNGSSVIELLQGKAPSYEISFSKQILHLGVNSIIFVVTLALSAIILKARDLTHLLSKKQYSISSN